MVIIARDDIRRMKNQTASLRRISQLQQQQQGNHNKLDDCTASTVSSLTSTSLDNMVWSQDVQDEYDLERLRKTNTVRRTSTRSLRMDPNMLSNTLFDLEQETMGIKPRRRPTLTKMSSCGTLDLALMEDESLGSAFHEEVGSVNDPPAPVQRTRSSRRLLSDDCCDLFEDEDLDQFDCGFRPNQSTSSRLGFLHDDSCNEEDMVGELRDMDVSRMSHTEKFHPDESCTSTSYDEADPEEDPHVLNKLTQAFADNVNRVQAKAEDITLKAGWAMEKDAATHVGDGVSYMARKSTFARNMDYITTRGSFFAKNIDYVQSRLEKTTTNLGNTLKKPIQLFQAPHPHEDEILSFLKVGTKIEVLEVMYEPELVAKVLTKWHAKGAKKT